MRMDLVTWLFSLGGVTSSAAARRAGFSDHHVRGAVAMGAVTRPRKGWLAVANADPHLHAAASGGVVLTCITQARRLGLWVGGSDERLHVAAPRHAGMATTRGARVHWAKPLVPRAPGIPVDPIENVLGLVAACQPFEVALAVWESALNAKIADIHVMRRFALKGAAREIAVIATPFSDSGLETFVCTRLRWMRVPVTPQAWILGHRVDFLIGDRLILQIDGAHHVGRQRMADLDHDATLMLHGYHVVRVGYLHVIDRWPEVQRTIMNAIAQGLHLAA